jgi:hypothetical protein
MFAESVWITYSGGVLPLEIALAKDPDNVYVFQITPPPFLPITLDDLASAKSRFGNRDRFGNSTSLRLLPRGQPITVDYKLRHDTWLQNFKSLVDCIFPNEKLTLVRGKSQQGFFHEICGFKDVRLIKIKTGIPVLGCFHEHSSRLIPHPCACVEVRTLCNYFIKKY